ncbi:MAG: DinB family protein [Gemmatimonadota bacterium]
MMESTAAVPGSARSSESASAQDSLLADVSKGLESLNRSVEAFVRPMESSLRHRPPPSGGWSVDSVLEHLCLAGELYLQAMTEALARSGAGRDRGHWRPTFAGRILAWSMVSTWRLRAPNVVVPGPVPRLDVLDEFLRLNASVDALLQSATDREWRRLRFASPLERRISLNFGDGSLIVLRHGERHYQQMARVARSLAG